MVQAVHVYTDMWLLLTVAANHTTDESSVDGLSISLLLHQLQNTVGHLHKVHVHVHCMDAVVTCRCCESRHSVCYVPVCACL